MTLSGSCHSELFVAYLKCLIENGNKKNPALPFLARRFFFLRLAYHSFTTLTVCSPSAV